jgi:hypothetical protein
MSPKMQEDMAGRGDLERFTVSRNGEPPYLLVLTQFRTENRFALFLELL